MKILEFVFRQGEYSTKYNFYTKIQSSTVEETMDGQNIKDREVKMSRENAMSVVKKLVIGSCVILTVGICAYIFLFLLMLAI